MILLILAHLNVRHCLAKYGHDMRNVRESLYSTFSVDTPRRQIDSESTIIKHGERVSKKIKSDGAVLAVPYPTLRMKLKIPRFSLSLAQ